MKLSCQGCGKEINLPDSKIPAGKSFSVKCPSCGHKISCKAGAPSANLQKEGGLPSVGREETDEASPRREISLDAVKPPEPMENYLEEYEGDELRALVCDREHRESIAVALKEMDCRMSVAENASMALNKMKFNQYQLLILNENFDGFSLKENPVFLHVRPMPMAERRHIFVALLGNNFKTRDQMGAYSLSVNLVINLKDLGRLARLLKSAMKENEGFYKIFNEALAAVGKG